MYRDWLNLHHANQRAALHITRPDQFRGLDPMDCEVVLGDCHWDNDAYMSPEYLWFIERQKVRLAS